MVNEYPNAADSQTIDSVRPVRPSFEGRDLSTAHAGSLRSPACFAQDDNGGRCGVMGARSESFLLSPSTSLWAGSPGLGSFYLTYSGLTSWANICRRFAAGGRVGRQPPWASAKSGATSEVKIPNLSRQSAARKAWAAVGDSRFGTGIFLDFGILLIFPFLRFILGEPSLNSGGEEHLRWLAARKGRSVR